MTFEFTEASRKKMSESAKAGWADPEIRACRLAALRNQKPRGRQGGRQRVIPKWVPADLHEEYRDHAKMYGEEAAASHCRNLKREWMNADA